MRRLSVVFVPALFIASSLSAATRTWTGTTSGLWSVAANWGGTAPVAGDDLVFPAGAANQTNTNDFPANTTFHSIAFTGGTYQLNGNTVRLDAGGIRTTGGTNHIAFPIVLVASQTWLLGNSSSVVTDIQGSINLNGFALTISVANSSTALSGPIAGNGSIDLEQAFVIFAAINTTTAPITGTDAAAIFPPGSVYLGSVTTRGFFGGVLVDTGSVVGPVSVFGPEGLFFAGDAPGGTVQSLTLSGLVLYQEHISSPTVFSKINVVAGPVTLSNVLLQVNGPVVPQGTQLTIVDNQGTSPVNGTFIGLPEGATVASSGSPGQNFTISYVGGTGNDIVLTAGQPISVTTSLGLTTSANPVDPNTPVTFTATVTPASGTAAPTGSVTFLDVQAGSTFTSVSVHPLGTVALNSSGVATLTVPASGFPGSHEIVALFNGGGAFGASSNSIELLVSGTIPVLDARLLALLALVLAAVALRYLPS